MLGYGSEAAFSTAFRRWTDISPGAYRRALRAGDTQIIAGAGIAAPESSSMELVG